MTRQEMAHRIKELETLVGNQSKFIDQLLESVKLLSKQPGVTITQGPYQGPIINLGGRCVGMCDYPSPWMSITPPTCRRCGMPALSVYPTYGTSGYIQVDVGNTTSELKVNNS
jgi:hypothetical protein